MSESAPEELRNLARAITEDAAEVDASDARGGAVREGLGRAAGRAVERAKNLERD